MASTTDSRTSSSHEGTSDTSPPSEGTVVSGPHAPANTIIHTLGNQVPNPASITALLGNLSINASAAPNVGTQTIASAPAAISTSKQSEQPETEHFHEASSWGDEAGEHVANGLKLLATYAKDEHQKDASKSVKQYYSEALAKIINDAEILFDVRCLEDAAETEMSTSSKEDEKAGSEDDGTSDGDDEV